MTSISGYAASDAVSRARPRPSTYDLNAREFGAVVATAIGAADALGKTSSATWKFSEDSLKKLADAGESAVDATTGAWDDLADGVDSVLNAVGEGLSDALDTVEDLASDSADALSSAAGTVGDALSSAAGAVSDGVGAVTDSVGEFAADVGSLLALGLGSGGPSLSEQV
ncbi:hypothetical protein [Ideonella margarita]|uniref:Uncharacterized protein n=1 Tax=Ideonella margarita TaxID=2984191 RepID=A0ABU9C9C5_9BURK